jgi:hypothetical protein
MIGHRETHWIARALVAAAMAVLVSNVALAQEPALPLQGDAAAPPAAAAVPPAKTGFFDVVGRWLEESRAKFKSNMDDAQEGFEKFGDRARTAAKDATGTIMTLPAGRVVTGREPCTRASNGAPDCRTAADAICKGKGFQTGKSVDTVAEEKCPVEAFLQGRGRGSGECRQETFVTRARCY